MLFELQQLLLAAAEEYRCRNLQNAESEGAIIMFSPPEEPTGLARIGELIHEAVSRIRSVFDGNFLSILLPLRLFQAAGDVKNILSGIDCGEVLEDAARLVADWAISRAMATAA